MALHMKDFDAYYLIICSRGPGTETMTIDHPTNRGIEIDRGAAIDLKNFGVCGGSADFNDEGPIILVPKGTLPLSGIFKWIAADLARWDEEMKTSWTKVLKQMTTLGPKDVEVFKQIGTMHDENVQAYLSSAYRVWLQKTIDRTNNRWTSCNGWRNVNIEIPSKRQFNVLLEAMGADVDELEKWNCAVLRKACKLYRAGKLPSYDFSGC